MNEKLGNVPEWIVNSKTKTTEQNNEVGAIVADYIGAFRKRKFTEKQIGSIMSSAFLLPVSEVEKRLDAVLSCGETGEEENVKNLCAFLGGGGHLFSASDSDPCEIIEILKNKYGKAAAFETMLTFPDILSVWKNQVVRENDEYKNEKKRAEMILKEVSSVFPEI